MASLSVQREIETLRAPLSALPKVLPLPTPASKAGAFDAVVRPPGSKSLSNRALLLAGLARGESRVRRACLDADDARQMLKALSALGAGITLEDEATVRVQGVDGVWPVPPAGVTLDINNAGTAARFLAAAALLSPAPVTIDGSPRMRERPIGQLGDALSRLGGRVEYLGAPGHVPMRIAPLSEPGLGPRIPIVELPTTHSSQFISALLLVAPWLRSQLTLKLEGQLTSPSYIAMTLGLLGELGASVQYSDNLRILRVGPPRVANDQQTERRRGLPAFDYAVEPDASGATYFWAAAAMCPGSVCRVPGLAARSLQGDAQFPMLLERMGARVVRIDRATSLAIPGAGAARTAQSPDEPYIEVRGGPGLAPILADMNDMPDAAMTLMVVASFASGVSILRGVRTLRYKESDRIAAMTAELAKVGVRVESPVAGDADVLTVTPPEGGVDCSRGARPVVFDTYDDHRIAMSLALLALRRPNIAIHDPQCVAKTYAGFWTDFSRLLQG